MLLYGVASLGKYHPPICKNIYLLQGQHLQYLGLRYHVLNGNVLIVQQPVAQLAQQLLPISLHTLPCQVQYAKYKAGVHHVIKHTRALGDHRHR